MFEVLKEYIKPELIVLIPIIYLIGMGLKKFGLADKRLLPILGVAGIALSGLYIFITIRTMTTQRVVLALFSTMVQGILFAGTAVYIHQLMKETEKEESQETRGSLSGQ